MSKEIILVDGLGFMYPRQGAPEFVLGRINLNINKLMKWVEENEQHKSEKGWLYINVLRSKNTGEPYLSLDTFKPNTENVVKEAVVDNGLTSDGNINPDDIPF